MMLYEINKCLCLKYRIGESFGGDALYRHERSQISSSSQGDLLLIGKLLLKTQDPNILDEGGNTPVHYAARGGHPSVIKYLRESWGANVRMLNHDHESPLHWACFRGSSHVEVCEMNVITIDLILQLAIDADDGKSSLGVRVCVCVCVFSCRRRVIS